MQDALCSFFRITKYLSTGIYLSIYWTIWTDIITLSPVGREPSSLTLECGLFLSAGSLNFAVVVAYNTEVCESGHFDQTFLHLCGNI